MIVLSVCPVKDGMLGWSGRSIDVAHAAGSDGGLDFKRAESCAGREAHRNADIIRVEWGVTDLTAQRADADVRRRSSEACCRRLRL
jgi:hypothetical protein